MNIELIDILDENGKFTGKSLSRKEVHETGLWHNTVHCWLYDKEGNVYFQIRKDEQKLYTTASGHIKAGETIKQGFGREIEEEIGIKIDYTQAEFVNTYKFVLDKKNNDGTIFKDRAFSNVYVCVFDGNYKLFNFDDSELSGIVKINAKDTLDLLKKGQGKIAGYVFKKENGINIEIKQEIDFKDFLVFKEETAIGKYGDILNKVIELTDK